MPCVRGSWLGDITWHAEIELMAKDGKPFFIATGAADLAEVGKAVAAAQRHNDQDMFDAVQYQLHGITREFSPHLAERPEDICRSVSGVSARLSDHSGHATVLGAASLWVRGRSRNILPRIRVERGRITASMSPADWSDMVERTRELQSALGTEEKAGHGQRGRNGHLAAACYLNDPRLRPKGRSFKRAI